MLSRLNDKMITYCEAKTGFPIVDARARELLPFSTQIPNYPELIVHHKEAEKEAVNFFSNKNNQNRFK